MSDEFEDEELIELEPDEPPKNGEWVDVDEVIENPTIGEMNLGMRMGLYTDPNDDDDDGFGAVSFGSATDERAKAMEKARDLKQVMLLHGVPEVSIELLPGRPNSFGSWDALFPVSEFSHHTVSRYGTNKTPVLFLCKKGRSDLPGPLCNGYGGWDLCYRIITFGYANHPGEGGPLVVPALTAGRFVIPEDSARRYAWGTEWEGGLNEEDWDRTITNPRNGKRMTMREFMGRSNAALEEYLEIANGAHAEHSTWTSRKIDRLHYTQAKGIAEKNKYQLQDLPVVDLSNIISQFRIARGIEKGEVTKHRGVKYIQRRLKRLGAPLKVSGFVDEETLIAWAEFETGKGSIGRPKIPDEVSLRKLLQEDFALRR